MKRISQLLLFVVFAGSAAFGGDLASKMSIESSPYVVVVQPRFETDDDGNPQFRCRLETKNERLVPAVSHLRFEAVSGEGEEEEILWSHKKVILRKQFTKRFGGRVGMFIREGIAGLPDEFETLKISLVKSSEEE